MSSIDRLTNLARGVISDGQKRFEEGGGLTGAARRVGKQAREAAETAREAVQEGLSSLSEEGAPVVADPARAAAEEEVASLRPRPRRSVSPSTPAPQSDALSKKLAALDARLHSGAIDKPTWESERAVLLDAHDRAVSGRTPRRRTL